MTETEWFATTDVQTMLAFVADPDPPPGAPWPAAFLSVRKVRLLLVGCCRRRWDLFEYPECRQALEVAERFADGLADEAERQAASLAARDLRGRAMLGQDEFAEPGSRQRQIMAVLTSDAAYVASQPSDQLIRRRVRLAGIRLRAPPLPPPIHPRERPLLGGGCLGRVVDAEARRETNAHRNDVRSAEQLAQANLLRCVAGDPFRVAVLDPFWRTPTVESLAQAAYDERLLPSGELDVVRLSVLADALEEAGASGDVLEHLRSTDPHVRGCWVVDLVRSVD